MPRHAPPWGRCVPGRGYDAARRCPPWPRPAGSAACRAADAPRRAPARAGPSAGRRRPPGQATAPARDAPRLPPTPPGPPSRPSGSG